MDLFFPCIQQAVLTVCVCAQSVGSGAWDHGCMGAEAHSGPCTPVVLWFPERPSAPKAVCQGCSLSEAHSGEGAYVDLVPV